MRLMATLILPLIGVRPAGEPDRGEGQVDESQRCCRRQKSGCRLQGDHLFIITPQPPLFCPVLPGGRRHGHFPQMWQFKKIVGYGKYVAVSGR
jgi:hypothetical protein